MLGIGGGKVSLALVRVRGRAALGEPATTPATRTMHATSPISFFAREIFFISYAPFAAFWPDTYPKVTQRPIEGPKMWRG